MQEQKEDPVWYTGIYRPISSTCHCEGQATTSVFPTVQISTVARVKEYSGVVLQDSSAAPVQEFVRSNLG
jgi:hypothetical protein